MKPDDNFKRICGSRDDYRRLSSFIEELPTSRRYGNDGHWKVVTEELLEELVCEVVRLKNKLESVAANSGRTS